MKMIMSLEQLNTLDAIKQFLDGTQSVTFKVATDKQERYRWVQGILVKHHYFRLGKTDKGTVTQYLMKVTGYSHAQTKRLIRQYVKSGAITTKPTRRNGFKRAYSETDIRVPGELVIRTSNQSVRLTPKNPESTRRTRRPVASVSTPPPCRSTLASSCQVRRV
jgi:hypothetical protein